MTTANLIGWGIIATLVIGLWSVGFYLYVKLMGLKAAITIMGGATALMSLLLLAIYLINL